MNAPHWIRSAVVATAAISLVAPPVLAESVAKKWRLGFSLGGYNPQGEIRSDSANILSLFERDFELIQQYIDPRDDSSVFGTLEVQPAGIGLFSAQYAVNNIFVLEATVGYSQATLGDVEVQAQFDGIIVDEDIGFNFKTFRFEAGEVDVVPVTLSAIARFRPRAAFNPYVGGGIGYSWLSYNPTEAFNQLSLNMDNSLGRQSSLSGGFSSIPDLTATPGPNIDLKGASVDASNSFTYHVVLGAEYTFKPRWALLLDFRYNKSSRDVTIGFDGQEDIGISVPFLTDFIDSPVASESFGALYIETGGLVDGGSMTPLLGQPPTTDCVARPQSCYFDVTKKDGITDPGFYYVNGGSVDLDAYTFTIGVRYTFK